MTLYISPDLVGRLNRLAPAENQADSPDFVAPVILPGYG
jgi:hypothetical protein